jgi:hypothetical protein
MNWTTQIPIKSGQYWTLQTDTGAGKDWQPVMVNVVFDDNDRDGTVYFFGNEVCIDLPDYVKDRNILWHRVGVPVLPALCKAKDR